MWQTSSPSNIALKSCLGLDRKIPSRNSLFAGLSMQWVSVFDYIEKTFLDALILSCRNTAWLSSYTVAFGMDTTALGQSAQQPIRLFGMRRLIRTLLATSGRFGDFADVAGEQWSSGNAKPGILKNYNNDCAG